MISETLKSLVQQQSVCFGVLLILMVFIFIDRRQTPALCALLSADALLAFSVVLEFRNLVYLSADGMVSRIPGVLSAALVFAYGAAMAAFFFLWKSTCRNRTWLSALIITLLPPLLTMLNWFFARKLPSFSIWETHSLLTSYLCYQRDIQLDLKRRTEEIEKHQAMLFQWQMQPHFIFNTMNTIRELLDSNPALAATGLDNLAGYLRKNLDALTLTQMIPFDQELTHIEQYVMLEKMNPSNLFEVVYDLQVIDFRVPALSVQPLVENAIRHGVRTRGSEGMVIVSTEQHGEIIRIIVEDNGPGFTADATAQQKTHISHGLENVRRRIETQCGGSLHIHSDGDGTRIVILMPCRERERG